MAHKIEVFALKECRGLLASGSGKNLAVASSRRRGYHILAGIEAGGGYRVC